MRIVLQKSGGGHDLTGLAVSALRHIQLLPRQLKRVLAISRKTFKSEKGIAANVSDGG